MSIESIEKGADREAEIALTELARGLIDASEYNRRIREIQCEAREYARDEAQDCYEDYLRVFI
jgi:hypothetical protein